MFDRRRSHVVSRYVLRREVCSSQMDICTREDWWGIVVKLSLEHGGTHDMKDTESSTKGTIRKKENCLRPEHTISTLWTF